MKVTFSQVTQINNYKTPRVQNSMNSGVQAINIPTENNIPDYKLSLANFPNVTFRANADADFLLSQVKHLKCAYSGLPMIAPAELKEIFQKLEKRINAQSAINLIQNYEAYLHDIESIIFDIIKEASHKTKRDFQDILEELKPEALKSLEEKQRSILRSTDKLIDKLSEPVAEQVREIKESALQKIEDKSFGRQPPLEMLKNVKATGSDKKRLEKIYKIWYKLPSSATDIDAFIVKYSRKPHADIARRLLSPSQATIEHIKPTSCGGVDELSNFILVSARFNNERHAIPLDEFIMLNSEVDISKNLQRYIDDIIEEMQIKKSTFKHRSWYPNKIRKAITTETKGKVNLNTDALRLTKKQVKENSYPEKLSEKYLVIRK